MAGLRICGDCTLCCSLLPVPWMDSPAGDTCAQCVVGNGCLIFATADFRCRSFDCMYLQADSNEAMRPDRCGVIFEKMKGLLVYGSIDPDIGFTDEAKGQVVAFNREGLSVVLDDMARETLIVAPRPGLTSSQVIEDFRAKRDARMRVA